MPETLDNILIKARAYCAGQEHCVSDVEDKLREWKCPVEKYEKIITALVRDGFLDEERYARAFASGKFRINHWGKAKIKYELERKKIPLAMILTGMEEIADEEYEKALTDLLVKKARDVKEKDFFKKRQKLIAFAVQKGFEYDLVRQIIKDGFKE